MKIEQNDEMTFLIKEYCDADIWDFLKVHQWLVLMTPLFELSEYIPQRITKSIGNWVKMSSITNVIKQGGSLWAWGGNNNGGGGSGGAAGGGQCYQSTNGTTWTVGNPNSAGISNSSFAYGGGSSYVYQQSSHKIFQITFKEKQDSMLFKLRWM